MRFEHFDPSCYVSNTNRLLKDAIPIIFTIKEETLISQAKHTSNHTTTRIYNLSSSTAMHGVESLTMTPVIFKKKPTMSYIYFAVI